MSRAPRTQVRALRLLGALLLGMGAIGAQAQGNSPTLSVAISAPANGAVITYPGDVALGATASINRSNWQILEVDFYSGSTLIGKSMSAPYNITWPALPAGTYTITAQAIATNPGQAKKDSPGPTWSGVSAPLTFRVNAPPTVGISGPASGGVFNLPSNITLTANAADRDGSIAKVEFYSGSTLIGTATGAPYRVTWSPGAGSYSVTARATDNDGALTASGAITLRVNAAPTVSISSPAAGAVFNPPAAITVTANAADTDGSIAKVEFFSGGTLIGTATSALYSITWANPAPGTYSLRAAATDNDGATTISTPVSVRVNAPPTVSISAPAAGASYHAPASIALSASAADTDGTIARVEFWQGATLLAALTNAPYTYTWSNVPAGSYSLTVKATDNDGGITTSASVAVTVTSATAQMYFIHADHLNTPRLVADATGTTVWRWDQQEPFGNDTPNADPNSTGTNFDFPLRFPGQYFDRETSLAYNYFRDYDPGIGRYTQSDPIGLSAGPNTYAYVGSAPLVYSDALGLDRTLWRGGPGRWGMVDGPRNGNWCGGDWSGGLVPSVNGGKDGSAKPMDSLDSCCMQHDICYAQCEKLPLSARGACVANCDRGLVRCLKKLDDDCEKWSNPPRKGTEGESQAYRDDTIRYFTEQVRKWDRQSSGKGR